MVHFQHQEMPEGAHQADEVREHVTEMHPH